MNLYFMTKWPETMVTLKNEPTNFVEKIWTGFPIKLDFAGAFNAACEQPYYQFCDNNNLPIQETPNAKLHTIRVDQNKRWKKGNKIHFRIWTGKPYNSEPLLFAPVIECVSVQEIIIKHETGNLWPCIYVDGNLLTLGNMGQLAINDGFNDLREFFDYFKDDFKGRIIHWTDLKY